MEVVDEKPIQTDDNPYKYQEESKTKTKEKEHPKGLDMSNFAAFKLAEKNYRLYKNRETDFSEVIDLNNKDKKHDGVKHFKLQDNEFGRTYDAYEFSFPEGLFIVKDYLSVPEQLELSKNCLNKYLQKPNRTNLYIYEDEGKKEEFKDKDGNYPSYDINQFLVKDVEKYYFNKKIRWANVGYQYDWNNREYPSGQTALNSELNELAMRVIRLMKMGDYAPEALIINYYDKKNYMGGHLDDGELDQIHPIISYSLGLSCIFLMGGEKKEDKPHAIRLDSGDVMIMSRKARKCYHGVPRVLEGTFNDQKFLEYLKNDKKEVYASCSQDPTINEDGSFENSEIHTIKYLKEDRINLNFRQVYLK